MEKLCLVLKDISAVEKDTKQLWSLLEFTQEILDELCVVYLETGDVKNRKAAMEESQTLELEIQSAIKSHQAIKVQTQISSAAKSSVTISQANTASPNANTFVGEKPSPFSALSQGGHGTEASPGGFTANHHLKPVKVTTYDGDKTKFEEFCGLFQSLVD